MSVVREGECSVALSVERQSRGALLLSVLVSFMGVLAEFDVRTATTLLQP